MAPISLKSLYLYTCMIAFLEGHYVNKTPAYVWMNVHGVGYEVNISLHTYTQIQEAEKGRLLTYLQVKEDAHTLFGFFEESERDLFLLLISVSGVGATTARMMLSSMKPEEIRRAIVQENERELERIKGIGAKSAKRLILELKDKVMKMAPMDNLPLKIHNKIEDDALHALISLGIARNAAVQAIQKALKQEQALSVEELIKSALKNI